MVTIILPVSRLDYLKEVFESLNALDCDTTQTSLLTYVDGDVNLFEKARNFTVASKFNQRLCFFRKKGPANVGSIHRRRQRIADIHNELKTFLANHENENDFVFLLEDDTLIPSDTLTKLLKDYEEHPNAGFISGMELGRWGYLHIGAWAVYPIDKPDEITSIPYSKDEDYKYADVQAAGFYCCLTKIKTYYDHFFKPFEEILGPDVDYGIAISQQGKQNIINRTIKCTHLTKKDPITFDGEIVQVRFKRMDVKFGWQMEVL